MKVVLIFAAVLGAAFAATVTQEGKGTPIDQVVGLIKGLAAEIEKDGKAEQAAYDKYSCWVEDTIGRVASEISKAKELIEELNESIKKGKAEIASHGAEITQLNKDIAQNNEAQKDATGLRNKENKAYAGDRSENEQCIGAMEAAIKVLTGAGTKKSGFLQQFHQAQLMSVALGVRKAMGNKRAQADLTEDNLEVVRKFVQNPGSFANAGMSAAQIGQNPFGDYAPQSSQIQGILKGMYDAFTADLEKDNANEANAQKNFEALMATKKQELATLEATLQKQETDMADKTKKAAEDDQLRDDTTEELAANEKFFEETKNAAEAKATEWSTRTRLRTEELAGMEGAIEILQGGSKVFQEATTTFLQLKAVSVQKSSSEHKAIRGLNALSAKYQSSNVARLVAVMKTGGHFDKVMVMIDGMMATLRQEEQEDIQHRDRCENEQNANGNAAADAQTDIDKTQKKIDRMDRSVDDKNKALGVTKDEIIKSNEDLAEMLKMRNQDNADFVRALKMDSEAISLIESAIVRLSKYYKENKIALELAQSPEYSQDPNKAPETDFSGADKRQGESGGIVAILSMIKEDLQKEMKEGRADEANAQADYEKQSGALQDTLDAQEQTKVSLEGEVQSLEGDISDSEKYRNEVQGDLDSEKDMKKSLATDCEWVQTHFDKRRKARKSEMDGLVEAKNFLAGVEAGDAVLAP